MAHDPRDAALKEARKALEPFRVLLPHFERTIPGGDKDVRLVSIHRGHVERCIKALAAIDALSARGATA